MNGNIFYLIPSIVCIVWMFIFILRKRNSTQKIGLQMLCISAVYFFLYMVIFSPGVDYKYVCIADVIALPWILGLLASLMIFVNAHMKNKILSNTKMQWLYTPAILEGGIVSVLYYLIGFDKVAEFFSAREAATISHSGGLLFENLPKEFNTEIFHIFYLFDASIFNMLTAVLSVIAIAVCIIAINKDGYRLGDNMRFLFKGAKTNPLRAISNLVAILLVTVMPLSLLGRTYIIQNAWIGYTISVAVSVEIFIICHCEAISNLKSFTLYDLLHVSDGYLFVDEDADNAKGAKESVALTSIRAIERNNLIIENLRKAFEEEKAWLNADLKLSELAERLNTNRNKLSLIFNQIYGNDFKSHVAELRINESKRIMKENPTATLEYIAVHSGFKERTVFLHRFKDLVGMTPTEWKLNN